MTRKMIFAASLLSAFSVALNAQNSSTYEGNFSQNWFVGAGAGVNSLYSLGAGEGFDGRFTPSAEVYFGKWFSPRVGARFGWQGVSMGTSKEANTNIGKMGMSYTHGDLLFNAASWLTPYAHAGFLTGWKLSGSGKDNELAMGAGLIGNVRISDHAALYMDIRSTLLPQRFAGVEGSRFSMLSSATAGITYNLSNGRSTGYYSNTFAEDEGNPCLGGFWDNWFIQTGAGMNTMVSRSNGHGWNGRITPALETLVGKWFSPTFGARFGWQGLTFSQWGRKATDNVFIANGIYKGGEMNKEKAGFNYIHGDILWDITRTIAGYNPERAISVIPYLHGGYMNEYTINQVPSKTFNNEWALGAGLLENIRIDDKMGVYFDMRAFILNHTMTGDELSGHTFAASTTAGLYYNLGEPGFKTNASRWSGYSDDINGSDWFVSTGYGINLFGSLKDSGYSPRVTPAYEISFGRWVNPYFGGRFGIQGLSYSQWGSDPKSYAIVSAGNHNGETFMEKAGVGYIHGDLLWNLSNQIGGINPDRTVSFIPYYHFGLADVYKSTNGNQANRDFGLGAGLLTNVLLSNRLSAYLDARATGYPSKMSLDKSSAYVLGLAFMGGLSWNLGGDSWSRTSETAGTDAFDSLLDNWFIQVGGGVNTFASKRHNVGFGGRITPGAEVALGKWLSPTFGVRAGWQGLTFSQWGEYPTSAVIAGEGTYKGRDVFKEKFGFNYFHADLMWDATDSFLGYNPDRFWRVVPYLHGGMVNAYTINEPISRNFDNELAGGAGLLNFFRLNDRASVYADFRTSTMAASISGDTHSGHTFSASVLSGLAYSFGKNYSGPRASFSSEIPDAILLNGFWDNWFVQAGGGVNLFTSHTASDNWYARVTPAIDVNLGKWFSPAFGARIGYQGTSFSTWGENPASGILSSEGEKGYAEKSNAAYIHQDLMWNLSNQIGGVRTDRFWSFIPYVHMGMTDEYSAVTGKSINRELGAGVGLLNSIRVNDQFGLYLDARGAAYPGAKAYDEGMHRNFSGTVTAGVTYNLQDYLYRRSSGSSRDDATYNGFLDNWFFSIGGGINYFDKTSTAAEFSFGKWFSPTFGSRLAVQGLSLKQNEVNDDNKFGYTYLHGDILWNLSNTIGGYRDDRFWDIVPYLHGGLANAYHVNSTESGVFDRELAAGAGILNNFRVSDRLGLYVDFRGTAMPQRFGAVEHSGYSLIGTILGGVTYNMGRTSWRNQPYSEDEKHFGPYIYNGFWDNWFINLAGGVNTLAYGNTGAGFNGRIAPAVDVAVGKWFSPSFGLRLGYQGTEFSSWGTSPTSNVISEAGTYKDQSMYKEKVGFAYIHSDMMWNLTNTILGYDEDRIWNLIPYAHAGYMDSINPVTDKVFTRNYAGGAGLINSIAINDRINLNADLRGFVLKKRMVGDNASAHTFAGSALLGLSYDLGKNYWSNGNGVLLNSFWDNWFIQGAAGVQTIAHRYNSVGFNGRISPSEEIMIGKWFSPTFGGRVGVQGVALSEWGSAPSESIYYLDGTYKGKDLSLEKFGSNYTHADLLWNFTNTVAGYDPDRKWDAVPYLHFGYINAYSMNTNNAKTFSREYASGAGLILSHDLDSKVSAYADMRAFLLKKQSTGDENALRTYAASSSIGLTYRLGNTGSSFDRHGWEHSDVDAFDTERPAKRWSISTNLVDLADYGTANIEVQRVLSRHITTDMQGRFNVWNFSDAQKRDQRQSIALGVRYWPWYTFSGIWVKGFAQVEEYSTAGLKKVFTIGRSSRPEKGSAYGAGISAGYALMLTKWFNIDFGIGGWGGYRDYFRFSDNSFGSATEHSHKFFAAPAELSISAMFVF